MNELIQRSKARQSPPKNLPIVPTKRKLSKAEINDASDTVRANLIDSIVKISAKLASLPDNLIGTQNLAQIAKLTDTAQKLFAWPAPKPVDSSAQANAPSPAINLALIHTTPEQLRAKHEQTMLNHKPLKAARAE